MRFDVEQFQFLVQFFQPFGEVETVLAAGADAHVAARVQAPALGFDLRPCGDFAQSRNILVGDE